jgi:hypothetical protein
MTVLSVVASCLIVYRYQIIQLLLTALIIYQCRHLYYLLFIYSFINFFHRCLIIYSCPITLHLFNRCFIINHVDNLTKKVYSCDLDIEALAAQSLCRWPCSEDMYTVWSIRILVRCGVVGAVSSLHYHQQSPHSTNTAATGTATATTNTTATANTSITTISFPTSSSTSQCRSELPKRQPHHRERQ